MCQATSDWTLGEGGWSQEQGAQGNDCGTKPARVSEYKEHLDNILSHIVNSRQF